MHCTWPGLADLRTGQDSVTGSSIDMYGGMEQRTVLSFTAAVLDWCIQPRNSQCGFTPLRGLLLEPRYS